MNIASSPSLSTLAVIQNPMQKAFLFVLIIMVSYSCHPDKTTSQHEYTPLILKRIDVTGLGTGQHSDSVDFEIKGYEHYVTVENYDEDAWDNFLVNYADKYIDTCKTNLPIWSVTFCRPFDYKPHGDSRDLDILDEHAILTIGYGHETLHKKHPDISFVEFWNDGKPTYIQLLTLDRAKDKGYYDSLGNYKTDFIKEMDNKFHTDFYQPNRK